MERCHQIMLKQKKLTNKKLGGEVYMKTAKEIVLTLCTYEYWS
jgi:hypothetical protein